MSSHVHSSPPGVARDLFSRAVDEFLQSLPEQQRQEMKGITRDDVINEVAAIQRSQNEKRLLRNVKRLEPFIEAMTQLGIVIDCFLNASEFVAFVWVCAPSSRLVLLALVNMPRGR